MLQLLGQSRFKAKAPAIVRASAYWTPRAMARESEVKAPRRRSVNDVDDMIENRKVIALEPSVSRKYKRALARAGYTIKKSMPIVQSKCDATGVFCTQCILFFPKEIA